MSYDFKTLLIVLTMARLLQSAGLLYVWRLHQNYRPARDWALGSAVVALGVLMVALRDTLPLTAVILIGFSAIFAGTLIFNLGILKAASCRAPLRAGIAGIAIALISTGWFTLVEPSILGRMTTFVAAMVAFDVCTVLLLLRAERRTLTRITRFIALLLSVETAALLMRFFATLESGDGLVSTLSGTLESGFGLLTIAGSMMMTLALAFLTSEIDLNERRRLEAALRKSSRFIGTILGSASDVAIIAAEKDLLITVFNTGAERLLGYTAEEVIGKVTPAIFADPEEAIARSRELTAQYGRPIKGLGIIVDDAIIGENRRWTWIRKDGGRVPVSMTVSAMRADDGRIIGYVGVAHDITKQVAYEKALQREIAKSEEVGRTLDTALSNMKQGLAMYDADSRLIICNDNYMRPFGLAKADTWPGMPFAAIAKLRIAKGYYSKEGPDAYLADRLKIAAFMAVSGEMENLTELNDGRFIRAIGHALPSGGCVLTTEDVTELKRTEARISYLAGHDTLTDLANRASFKVEIERVASSLNRDGTPFNILMLDLDRFKTINDTLGHAAGDELLRQVARRLKATVRESDVVARLGGDEFAIIQSSPRDDDMDFGPEQQREAAHQLADRILAVTREPFDIDGKFFTSGASIGVALAPRDGTDPDDLLRKADVALYASKSAGRNAYRIFDPQMLASTQLRDQLELELRVGIDCEEFVLHYQPIVDPKTREVRIVEALVRWNHPRLGLMPPDRFIELAEETGLIVPLGDWILRQACRDAATWPDHVAVAVNLSAAQFKNNNPLDAITSALLEAGLPADRLEVEVTESVVLGQDADCIDILRQLRAMGVSVALDDFGTGYSSLTYLKRFQFDKIKIDRSFIKDIVGDSDSMTIVSGVCNMARGLNMTATAEGVETEDQFALLRIAGIDFAQGYLFGRPGPAEALDFGDPIGLLRESA